MRTHGPMDGLWHELHGGRVPKAQENSGKMLEDQNQMGSKQTYAKCEILVLVQLLVCENV